MVFIGLVVYLLSRAHACVNLEEIQTLKDAHMPLT